MKRIRLLADLAAVSTILLLPTSSFCQDQKAYLTGEVLVRFHSEIQEDNLPYEIRNLDLQYLCQCRLPRLVVFKYPNTQDIQVLITQLEQLPYVEFAEPNIIYFNPFLWTPEDTHYPDPPCSEKGQWYLRSSESNSIDADLAWDVVKGSGQKIAVLDAGISSHCDVNYNTTTDKDAVDHYYDPDDPYIYHHDWDGGGEYYLVYRATNDYETADTDVEYEYEHGLAVAGVAGAKTDNGEGIAAVAPSAQLVIVRVAATYHINKQRWNAQQLWHDVSCEGIYAIGIETDDLVNAIIWAVDNGDADVIVMCFGLEWPFDTVVGGS